MIFPHAVSSLNNTKQLIHYNNLMAVVEQCFIKIAAIQTCRYYINLNLRNIWGCSWYVKIPQCGYKEHELKDIGFYVQKHIAPRIVL